MRVQVYEEELTGEAELIRKDDVIGEDGQPVTFYGVRFWLKGSGDLHHTEHDDDRPAVTFWFRAPGSRAVAQLFEQAAALIYEGDV